MTTFDDLYAAAKDLPIIDWHNHLDMRMLAEDKPLGSLYETWVKSAPYKHRAMRICGEPERLITGDASEDEKWAAWTRTLPKLVGNPIFAWAKMELEFLGLDASAYLRGEGENLMLSDLTPSKLLSRFKVEYMSPCVAAAQLGERASRPFHWENGRLARSMGMQMTGQATGETPVVPVAPNATGETPVVPVASNATGETPVVPVCNGRDARSPSIVPSLRMNAGEEVAEEALARFHAAGCRVVDISVDDAAQLETCYDSLASVAAFAAAHGWTMLLHMGALRETSTRLRAAAGPAGGYAGMRSPVDPAAVAAFLDGLERKASLPRTILMTLNPEAHAQLATLAGSFVEEGVPGKVQLGPAWWWCDHAEGIRDVLEKQAAYGVLSTFVGMTTDSRSLLSFVRHDYFRRLFCRWVADKVSAGDFPDDRSLLLPLVEKVCYANAKGMLK